MKIRNYVEDAFILLTMTNRYALFFLIADDLLDHLKCH